MIRASPFRRGKRLVEEAEDLAGNVLTTSLLVVHDTGRGGQDNVTERTGGQELLNPVLNLTELNVEARRNDTALVDASVELDDNLAGAVVVDLLELSDVAFTIAERRKGMVKTQRVSTKPHYPRSNEKRKGIKVMKRNEKRGKGKGGKM